jgi:hypothetical protein
LKIADKSKNDWVLEDGKIVVNEERFLRNQYITHEKEIGQLGYDCRFLVKLVASFQDRVN